MLVETLSKQTLPCLALFESMMIHELKIKTTLRLDYLLCSPSRSSTSIRRSTETGVIVARQDQPSHSSVRRITPRPACLRLLQWTPTSRAAPGPRAAVFWLVVRFPSIVLRRFDIFVDTPPSGAMGGTDWVRRRGTVPRGHGGAVNPLLVWAILPVLEGWLSFKSKHARSQHRAILFTPVGGF